MEKIRSLVLLLIGVALISVVFFILSQIELGFRLWEFFKVIDFFTILAISFIYMALKKAKETKNEETK